jgi:hypothetical protein
MNYSYYTIMRLSKLNKKSDMETDYFECVFDSNQ